MFSTKNINNLKSRSAGSTTRGSGRAVSQPAVLKTSTGVKTQTAIASTPKAARPTKTPKAPERPKPFVVSKALVSAKAPSPGTLKTVAAFKALNYDDVLQTPTRLKPRARPERLLVAGAADAPKHPPGLRVAVAVPARSAAVEAVRRQISEQQQKVSAIAARKASSGPLRAATLKVAPVRDIRPDASAPEDIPPVGTRAGRPLPAVRKGGVRKSLVGSRASLVFSSPGSPTPEGTASARRQRNSLPPPSRTAERASLMRRKTVPSPAELKTPKPIPAAIVTKSRSAPVLGRATALAATVTKSQSVLSVAASVIKSVTTKDADEDAKLEEAQVKDEPTPAIAKSVLSPNPSTPRLRTARPIAPPTELMKQRIAARRLKLSIQGFTVHALVGQGSYGTVVLVSLKGATEHKTYALKAVLKAKASRSEMLVEQEAARMVSGRPFLAGIEASFHDMDNFYLLMEYCPMSLSDHWRDNAQLPTIRVQLWTAEIATGLDALHKLGILHRDLKLENILIGPDGHVRIADFGLAKRFARSQLTVPIKGGVMFLSPLVEGVVGTAGYRAPEMWRAEPYSFAVDWWALGVMVYALTFGKLPWDHKLVKELERLVLETEVPIDATRSVDPELVAFIRKALQKKVYERIKFEDVQAMSFFSSINWDRVASNPLRLPAPSTPIPKPTSTPFMFPTTGRPFPSGGDPIPELTWASDAFAKDKIAADAVLEDEELVREAIVSLDGEAPVFDTPAAWKAAFGVAGGAVPVGSPVGEKVVSEVKKGGVVGVKKWWKRVVGKACGRA